MQRKLSSITRWALLIAVVVVTMPVIASAQLRVVVTRPRRQRVMVYQPAPRVIYRQTYSTPYYNYGYTQPYTSTRYYSYGYPTPYYSSGYSYAYTQPYYGNGYTYTRVAPTYNYSYREYPPRYRRNRVRIGINFR